MNKFDERRRALLSCGGGKYWIFKEGEGFKNGATPLGSSGYYTFTDTLLTVSCAYRSSKGEYSTNVFLLKAIDLSPYKKLCFEGHSLYADSGTVGYTGGTSVAILSGAQTLGTASSIKEIDISTISGSKYIGIRAAAHSVSVGLNRPSYIKNIWLE